MNEIIKQLNEKIKEEDSKRTAYQNFIVILLAVLGGCSVLIEMLTPILLILIWTKLFGFYGVGSYIFYSIALLAVVYRSIKVGYLK